MNSQLYITTRMMFSLSRAGSGAAAFRRLSARGVPVQALLFSSAASPWLPSSASSHRSPRSSLMVSISSFGAMFTWMMIFVTHYRFRRARRGEPRAGVSDVGFPFTTLLGVTLMAAVLVTTAFTAAFRLTLVFGLPFLALLCVVYWYRYGHGASSRRAS